MAPCWQLGGLLAPPWRIKAIYVTFFAGQGSVLSFLPVFFARGRNLSFSTVGTYGMLSPLARFVGAPLLGAVMDHVSAPRVLLIAVLLVWLGMRASLLALYDPVALGLVFTVGEFIGSAGMPTIENGVLAVLEPHQPYGHQRMFGALGYGFGVFTSGLMLKASGAYWPIFAQQAFWSMLLLWAVNTLPLGRYAVKKQPAAVTAIEDSVLPRRAAESKARKRSEMAVTVVAIRDQDQTHEEAATAAGEDGEEIIKTPETAGLQAEDNKTTEVATGSRRTAHDEADMTKDEAQVEIVLPPSPALPSLTAREKARSIWQTMTRDSHTIVFFTVIVMAGMGAGVIENFLFLFIGELGGSEAIQGLARLVMCVCEVPFFWYARPILKRLGVYGSLVLTFVGYTLRFCIYSFMTKPWMVVASEPLHGLTFAVMWSAATTHAFEIAPPGLGTTMQGLVGGLHFGLGIALGSVIGGSVYEQYGAVVTFRCAAVASGTSLIALIINQRFGTQRQRVAASAKYTRLEQEEVDEDESAWNAHSDEEDL